MQNNLYKKYKQQLLFIKENENILNMSLKSKIIWIIKSNIDDTSTIFKKNSGLEGTFINLNEILYKNPDIIINIYNLVSNRLALLNTPKI